MTDHILGGAALGVEALGGFSLVIAGGSETPEETPGPVFETVLADEIWPVDDLKPRDIGIYPIGAAIGGGMALTGKEPAIASGHGYWRIILGAIPVKTRANIMRYRSIEARLEGRSRTIAIPIYDGKRAPWPDLPGGDIDAESANIVPADATHVRIIPTNIGDLEVGMHFSAGHRLYRITALEGSSAYWDCTIWPPVREAFDAGTPLEFRRPLCMVRLARDDGMALALQGHKRGEATLEFVEAL